LESARIGEKVEFKKFQIFCLEKSGKVWKSLERSGKRSKNDKNDYKLSLGGRGQKLIDAMDSARIGEKV
jgi:hypothetical protein